MIPREKNKSVETITGTLYTHMYIYLPYTYTYVVDFIFKAERVFDP